MAKASKLTEKGSRFSTPRDTARNSEFEIYKKEIVTQNIESARSLRFTLLLNEWFAEARPSFVEDYLKGIEKYVKMKGKDFIIRGRIDALYGNAIIEFEHDLKKKLKEAKRQLQEYAFCLLNNEKEKVQSYLCIASDGILFYVYTPRWDTTNTLPDKPEDIILYELDRIDFSSIDGNKAFLWLDRYFFRNVQLKPTTEEFVRDFGINSPAYAFAVTLLQNEWKRVGEKGEFKVIYENWEKYLRIAYGTSVANVELFLRHTYLASFAKLLAYMRLSEKTSIPTENDVVEVFAGKFFKERGIQNFIEEDFFAWVAREKVRATLVLLTQRISTLLERYHLKEISEDVLKSLYQELVDPETRHDLGEYYTPDWLAERIVHSVLKQNPSVSVLDPSCGSGSFLYFSIRYKKEQLGTKTETLHHIRDSVVGIDCHPLAVIIAKTNYLLGLGELVRKRMKKFYIPVYLADSLKIPEQSKQISTDEKVPSVRVELDNHEALIPETFISLPSAYDEAVELCHDFAKEHHGKETSFEEFKRYAKRGISEIETNTDTLEVLFTVALRMKQLIENDRDSIWSFILKNVYKPIFLKKKFDWIIGNPPWLSYRYVEKGKYQEFLRWKIIKEYGLLPKGEGHLITHLELGTLFFAACLCEYGNAQSSRIAFVLPRSIFTADQHDAFRKASLGKALCQIGITEVWDLENVSPLFNVPSCVIFGKSKFFTKRPIPSEILSGMLPRRNASLLEAAPKITSAKSLLHIIQQGNRSYWTDNPTKQMVGASPYASKFAEGATLVPRSCWFVEIVTEGSLGFNPSTPFVRTDQRATAQAKETYKNVRMEGNIEKDFLYATLLSTDLLPFGFLDYRAVVLPIKESGDNFFMIQAERAKKDGNQHLARWLTECEREWKSRRKEKASRMTIYQRLDHVHGITNQSHKAKYKVLYPSSATNLCSAVALNEKIKVLIHGQKITLKHFVAESKTYFFETENEYEAHYLSAILNSPTIDEVIKPMQSKGQWGPRDIHKKVWQLPIPAYKETNKSHVKLAELGIACAEKVKRILPELETNDITPGKIGRLRNQVRERLNEELGEIDGVVKGIMKR